MSGALTRVLTGRFPLRGSVTPHLAVGKGLALVEQLVYLYPDRVEFVFIPGGVVELGL